MTLDRPLSFGELLRSYRIRASLTQEELAERAGLSVRGISDLERGVKRAPRKDTIELLATALELPPGDRALFDGASRRGAEPSDAQNAERSADPTSPPFVGRVDELRLLRHHLEQVGPPVLVLAGEPGIGKTRLLTEATRLASERGWTVLQGGCQRHGGQEPYTPFLMALGRYIFARSRTQQRILLRACAWLIRLLPELADTPIEPLPIWALPPEQERRLVFAAVSRFLGNVAGQSGTLLILDDLQWAGSDALELLESLVGPGSVAPVRVIGAYRDTESGPYTPLATALADLAHAGLATQHVLTPLDHGAADGLLDALLTEAQRGDPLLRARLLQRAGGMPFFLVSCAQGLRSGALAADAGDALPWDLRQGLRQRVAALPVSTQDVLGTAAVIGRRFHHDLVIEATPCSAQETATALDTACRARIIGEDDDGQYLFTHDVIREVIEGDLGAARRALLHRRVAEALERAEGQLEPAVIAYHYGRGGLQEKAVDYLERAGDRACAEYAHTAAQSHYYDATERLDRLGHRLQAARVREKLGAVLRVLAAYDEALEVLEAAADTYRSVRDLDRLGHVTALIGQLHAAQGTPAEGIACIQPLLTTLDAAGATQSLAALYAALAHTLFVSGRYGEQLAAAERAAELARSVGDRAIAAEAEGRRGLALLSIELIDDALPVLDTAVRMAEDVGDLTELCHALNHLARGYLMHGEFDRAMTYQQRALEIAERLGDPTQVAYNRAQRGLILYYTGEWRTAREECAQALVMSDKIGLSWAAVAAPLTLGLLHLVAGEWVEASHYLGESAAIARRSADTSAWQWAQSMLAEQDLLRGHPIRARDRLITALHDAEAREHSVLPWVLSCLARAHLVLGDLDAATDIIGTMIRHARTGNARINLAVALWVRGLIETRQGSLDEAARTLDEALTLSRDAGYVHHEARVLGALGALLLARNEQDAARDHLRAAGDLFRRLGAREEAAPITAALAALSQNPTAAALPEATVTDEQWRRIQAFLPAPTRTGRPRVDDRRMLEAILYVHRSGCAWAELPPMYGNDATAHRRWQNWQARGIWNRILTILQIVDPGDSARSS